MAQPNHITISSSIAKEYHDLIRAYITIAASLANTELSGCEVHVKLSSRPAHGISGSSSCMTGAAYFWYTKDRKPGGYPTPGKGIVKIKPGMRFLVTLKLTRDFAYGIYPYTWHYARYKTAPPITYHDWTEEFLHLTVHEFRHIHQYVFGLPRSEIDCEQFAHSALYRARAILSDTCCYTAVSKRVTH